MLAARQSRGANRLGERRNGADVALYGIYEISKILGQPVRLEVTLGKVLGLLSSFLDMRHGLIALLDDQGGHDLVVGSGWSAEGSRRYFESLPKQAIGRIVVTQMPLVVENVADDALFAGSPLCENDGDHVSFIGVPVKDRGHVIGTLTIDRDLKSVGEAQFSFDDDVRFLRMVGNLLGQTVRLQRFIARDRARMFEEQRRLEQALGRRVDSEATAEDGGEEASGIVGESLEIKRVIDKVRTVARSQSTVLLRGESGTGKELFARALHDFSRRSDKPFVTLNCAALPEGVLESELFGHERGSFTGAQGQRKGRFELADGGTLFLDEIGEISPQFQAKLLRVLQLGEFERVGGTTTMKVDVRIVSATNRNLEAAVAAGDFRADLYYRLSVVPILLPPLRERQGDIPLLAMNFLKRFNEENETKLQMTDGAFDVLMSCSFPGNVRELENCVCRTATLARGPVIDAGDFACFHDECLSAMLWRNDDGLIRPDHLVRSVSHDNGASARSLPPSTAEGPADGDLADRERLVSVLESVGWVQAKAARVLGLTPRQIGYAIRKHDIQIKKF